MPENAIEFLNGDKEAYVTFCSMRYKNRIRKLSALYPDQCQIISEDGEGGMLAKVPVEWIRVTPPARKREISEEERAVMIERLRKAREKQKAMRAAEESSKD